MSFSAEVKHELCRISAAQECCARAELYGMLLFSSCFSHQQIRVMSGNPAIIKRCQMLMNRAVGLKLDTETIGKKTVLSIVEQKDRQAILHEFGYDYKPHLTYHLNRNILENECCLPAFLRGAFLLAGSVAGPEAKSHLEMSTTHSSLCNETVSLLLDLNIAPKLTCRQGRNLIYFKDRAQIEDFLTLLGAKNASMTLMEAQVEKTMRNQINRQANCETANMVKSADASARQIAAIMRAMERRGEECFPESLRETVHIRMAHPTDSLSELSQRFDPPISKPGLSHRLRRIVEIASSEE